MENNRPEFVITTDEIYSSFCMDIAMIRKGDPIEKNKISILELVKSAFVKNYDFVLYLCKLQNYESAFFQLPMLRSICEDLIAISYLLLETPANQKSLIATKSYNEFEKALTVQEKFFFKYNPGQISISPTILPERKHNFETLSSENNSTITEINFPKVFKMANKAGLQDIYEFIYHSTSKAVHFDVFNLLAMGWGEINTEKDTIEPTFSFKNNYHQYFKFALFYSSYLFILQTTRFQNVIPLSKEMLETIKKLENQYKQIDWPEIISHRQMNLKEPSTFFRAVYREISKKQQ